MGTTRFRAYQLGEEGSSFSYCHEGHFTLIEARLTFLSKKNILQEILAFGSGTLNDVHITSWDKDHCNPNELKLIVDHLKPARIDYPGYDPHTDSGKESLEIIRDFKKNGGIVIKNSPQYLDSLGYAEERKRNDVMLWPREISAQNSNDNSTAKIFRKGHFTVLSLGDLESYEISKKIAGGKIMNNEIDIVILAHHGADNGFTNQEFLSLVIPRVAVCTSNYDSQYNHPRDKIRSLLNYNQIPIFTTKTGDVIIQNIEYDAGKYTVVNLQSDSKKISSVKEFYAKTY